MGQKALATYTLTNEWMPVKPNYKPYCALANKEAWLSESEMMDDEGVEWGIDRRNQIEELNKEENKQFFDEGVSKSWHPCNKYFTTESNIDRQPFTTPWDPRRLLTLENLIKSAGTAAK